MVFSQFDNTKSLPQVGRSYILKNYGFIPARGYTKSQIFINLNTSIIPTNYLNIDETAMEEATKLINPPSLEISINDVSTSSGLVTISGKVANVSIVFLIIL